MMTSLSGRRGIGKTYELSKEVYERYKRGFFIITNFSHVYSNLDCSGLSPNQFYDVLRQLLVFKDRGFEMADLYPAFPHSGVFIAIDEGHLYFSADLWKRYQTEDQFQEIIKLLAQARKQDIEIWYTTQDPSKIDKNWRRYTEDWIRYTPVFNMRYKKLIFDERKQIFKRELRYLIPLVWQEWHELDSSNPVFDYAMVEDEDGFKYPSEKSTMKRRVMKMSGYLNPFPYKLYDSNQVLAIVRENLESTEFDYLKSFSLIPHTFKYERYPSLKKLLHIRRNDEELPPKIFFKKIDLPEIGRTRDNHVLLQPKTFVDDLKSYRKVKLHFLQMAHSASSANRAEAVQKVKQDTGE